MERIAASATAGLRKGRLFIISKYAPGPGTYIDKSPVLEVPPYDPGAIGEAALKALESFTVGGDIPDWNKYRSPVLDLAGLERWSEYERGLKECIIDQHDDGYYIFNDEFYLITDGTHIQIPRDADAGTIGEGVLKALGTSSEKERRQAGM